LEEVVMDPTFWAGRKVFLTGHTGFKGGWLALWLQQAGAQVLGYSLAPPSSPSMFEEAGVGVGMRTVFGDIRDLQKISTAMGEFRPEVVFHLAAQSLVRLSYADPVGTYATNVMGTVNVLEAIRAVDSVRAAVVISSDKCYENNEWVWGYRETDPMGGYDPYSSSKGCTELVSAAYRQSYFSPAVRSDSDVRLASGRAGNVIGGGDWATDRLVPDFIRAMSLDEPIHIRNPQAQRPWQHVLEPLSGYVLLAERLMGLNGPDFTSGWNFGPEDKDAITVSAIVKKLTDLWGPKATYRIAEGEHLHEAAFLKLDCSKARARLGWRPRIDVDAALTWTVEWHKSNIAGMNMRDVTLGQIARFSAAIPAVC
jgi:CDP-glucose 4,6-dehydratase